MTLRKVYDQDKDVGRAYREAAALISELDLWGCGAPPEVLIGVAAASWLNGVRAGLREAIEEMRP